MAQNIGLTQAHRIVAVEAHPDDLEVAAGATLALLARRGASIHVVSMTGGERGTKDEHATLAGVRQTREAEAREAAEILGLEAVHVLPFQDMCLADTPESRGALVEIIRRVEPDTLFCLDPMLTNESHPDHLAAGRIALAACIFSAFPLTPFAAGRPWAVSQIVLYGTDRPNRIVDVSATWDLKWRALASHSSQFPESQLRERIPEWTARARRFASREGAGLAEPLRLVHPNEIHMNLRAIEDRASECMVESL